VTYVNKVKLALLPGGSLDFYVHTIAPVVEVAEKDTFFSGLEQMVDKYEHMDDKKQVFSEFAKSLKYVLENNEDFYFRDHEGDVIDLSIPIEQSKNIARTYRGYFKVGLVISHVYK